MDLLVISGGRHPYRESTPVLERFLKAAGHVVTVTEDASVLGDADEMSGYDALVFNTLRSGNVPDNWPDFRNTIPNVALAKTEQDGMKRFISSGKGFVCLHVAGCAPDTWPEYRDITGGGWVMGESYHRPYGKFTVNVSDSNHPGAKGISDFTTSDELYMVMEFEDGNDYFITADAEEGNGGTGHFSGGTYSLGWTRKFGDGKVFVTLLGHDGPSFETPEFQTIVLNGVSWATTM